MPVHAGVAPIRWPVLYHAHTSSPRKPITDLSCLLFQMSVFEGESLRTPPSTSEVKLGRRQASTSSDLLFLLPQSTTSTATSQVTQSTAQRLGAQAFAALRVAARCINPPFGLDTYEYIETVRLSFPATAHRSSSSAFFPSASPEVRSNAAPAKR